MSKLRKLIFLYLFVSVQILQSFYNSPAQSLEAKIKIADSSTNTIQIEGKILDAEKSQNFYFLNSFAGENNLGNRISNLLLFNEEGEIKYKKLIEGEFLAEKKYNSFAYQFNAALPPNISAQAHISWFTKEKGILMTADLLPELGDKKSAKITFALPANLKITTVEKRLSENVFEVSDISKAIFFVGVNQREKEISVDKFKLNISVTGDFLFSDDELFKMSNDIFNEYRKLFGENPQKNAQILLVKFPSEAKSGRWEAETRGSTVTILSADMPFKSQSSQRLHEQLRHEIFHLWMPNNLNLSGNYDWFYEGFALYQSLRTGIAVNKIRFEDFLDTLARTHSIDSLQTQKVSLIEASRNRWNGANTQVYARGMLVAFLCDITILQKTKGKRSLSELLGEIYQKHRLPNQREEGNVAILRILENYPELRPIVEKYIKGTEKIEWQAELKNVGIVSKEENFSTKLMIEAKPNGRQKDLLDKLGYNNWRKLTDSSK